jgi:O-antigen/teichoic acid export membrane protein
VSREGSIQAHGASGEANVLAVSDDVATQACSAAPTLSAPQPHKRTLRSLFARAAVAEVAGFGVAQLLRLGSNLILTRILYPEAFGLMAMLYLVLYGLQMLTDVGVAQAAIRSPRGEDPIFLDTTWSIKAVRGLVLWILASLLAWPISVLFREPTLLLVIPVGSASVFVQGLYSMRLLILRRQLRPAPIITLDLSSQVLGLLTTVGLALGGFGLWALVAGSLVGATAHTGFSYVLPGTHRERFRIEPEARREILHFGRWIYASSAVTFAAGRGDQIVLARLLGAASLGVYNIALALAELPDALIGRVIDGVLFPTYSRIHNERPAEFVRIYYRTRLVLDALAQTALGGLVALGPWLIHLMYDARYQDASAMLQILALRTSLTVLAASCETALFAQGHSMYGFRRNAAVALATFIAMPVGYALGGAIGLIWGTTLARAAAIPVLWPAARRMGMLRLHRELLFAVFLAGGYGVGRALLLLLPAG